MLALTLALTALTQQPAAALSPRPASHTWSPPPGPPAARPPLPGPRYVDPVSLQAIRLPQHSLCTLSSQCKPQHSPGQHKRSDQRKMIKQQHHEEAHFPLEKRIWKMQRVDPDKISSLRKVLPNGEGNSGKPMMSKDMQEVATPGSGLAVEAERNKRSPGCVFACLRKRMLHPAMCHSYCRFNG